MKALVSQDLNVRARVATMDKWVAKRYFERWPSRAAKLCSASSEIGRARRVRSDRTSVTSRSRRSRNTFGSSPKRASWMSDGSESNACTHLTRTGLRISTVSWRVCGPKASGG